MNQMSMLSVTLDLVDEPLDMFRTGVIGYQHKRWIQFVMQDERWNGFVMK